MIMLKSYKIEVILLESNKKNMKNLFTTVGFVLMAAIASAQHFQPIWQTPFSPMNIYVTSAELDELMLDANDEIAVFDLDDSGNEICVGTTVLTAPIGSGDFELIICSMDDGTVSGVPNGFTAGNEFIFRFWSEDIGEITNVNFEFPFPDYDQVFTALGSTIVDLSATYSSGTVQTFQVTPGWSGISSYVVPDDSNIENLFATASAQLQILYNMEGDIYQPEYVVNTIGNWDTQTAYIIKTSGPTSVTFDGLLNFNKTIAIQEGWNLMPVISDCLVQVGLLNAGITGFVMIKEVAGTGIYWPSKNINTIDQLVPGEAYYMFSNSNGSYTYPDCVDQ